MIDRSVLGCSRNNSRCSGSIASSPICRRPGCGGCGTFPRFQRSGGGGGGTFLGGCRLPEHWLNLVTKFTGQVSNILQQLLFFGVLLFRSGSKGFRGRAVSTSAPVFLKRRSVISVNEHEYISVSRKLQRELGSLKTRFPTRNV